VIMQSTGPRTAGQSMPTRLSPLCVRGDRCPPELACHEPVVEPLVATTAFPSCPAMGVCQHAHTDDAFYNTRRRLPVDVTRSQSSTNSKPGARNAWAAESARCRCASRSRPFLPIDARSESSRSVGTRISRSTVARLGYLPISKQLFCKHSHCAVVYPWVGNRGWNPIVSVLQWERR
jgi:hypothetical protein